MLLLPEHRQLGDKLPRTLGDCLQQVGQMRSHARDRRCFKQRSRVVELYRNPMLMLDRVQREVELRGLSLPGDAFDLQTLQAPGISPACAWWLYMTWNNGL